MACTCDFTREDIVLWLERGEAEENSITKFSWEAWAIHVLAWDPYITFSSEVSSIAPQTISILNQIGQHLSELADNARFSTTDETNIVPNQLP